MTGSPPAPAAVAIAALPAAPPVTWRRRFPGDERQIGALRRWVTGLLPPCPAREDALIVAAELGTNAIRHTASGQPEGCFTAQVHRAGAVVRITVTDLGAPGGLREDGSEGQLAEDGRGLLVVRALSAATGVTGDHRGRSVWADLAWPTARTPETAPCQPATAHARHTEDDPMPEPAASGESARIHDERAHHQARAVMLAVADGLTQRGLDIRGQEWDEAHYLMATNARGALCQATIGASGKLTWEYRPTDGPWTDPAPVAAMVADLLGGLQDAERRAQPGRCGGQSLKGAVGLAARRQGMQARLGPVLCDDVFLEVSAEVEIVNPRRPERGRVCVRDNVLRWECRFAAGNQGTPAMDPADIVSVIGMSVPQLRVIGDWLAAGPAQQRRPS